MPQKRIRWGFFVIAIIGLGLLNGMVGAQGDIITTIPVDFALSLGINPNTERMYVGSDQSIVVLDTTTNQIVDTIPTGVVSFYIATNPVTNKIYATDSNTPYHLLVINGVNNSIEASIEISGSPNGVAVDSIHNLIYVTNGAAGDLEIIDGLTNTIIDSVSIGNGPGSVAVNPMTNRIYIGSNANTISVVDGVTRTVIAAVPVGTNPNSVTVNTFTNTIYVSSSSTTTALGVIDGDTNTLINSVPIEDYGNKVIVNSIINRVYFLTAPQIGEYSTILVFDGTTHSIIDSIVFDGTSYDLAPNELTSRLYAITRLPITAQSSNRTVTISAAKDGISGHFRVALSGLLSPSDGVAAAQVDAGNTIAVYQDIRPPLVGPKRNYFRMNMPTLTWSRLDWATGYEIQVDDNSDFLSNEFHDNAINSATLSATTTVLGDGQYYWRVRGKRTNGTWGNWSIAQTFAVNA